MIRTSKKGGNNLKKLLALLLSVTLSVSLLAGCQGTPSEVAPSEENKETATAEEASALEELVSEEPVTVKILQFAVEHAEQNFEIIQYFM
ncbi:MAG: hypothetical protein R3Y24_07250 [Eubacteriales bacterium]